MRSTESTCKRLYLKTLLITLAVCLALLGAAYGVFLYMIGGLDRTEVDEDNLSVNGNVNERSSILPFTALIPAITIITVPLDVVISLPTMQTGQVKLVSIARDTYVAIPVM